MLTRDFNKKIYSVDNYDKLRRDDFSKMRCTLREERLRIVRFLALKARKETDAKSYKEIAKHVETVYKPEQYPNKFNYRYHAARKGCMMLRD